jgi:hypothetical protein
MGRIRRHLTYANVMATLAVFLVLGGGTAIAAYVVSSNSQIGPGTVSGHKPPTGKHANIIAGSINGQDIADQSGVDTCKAPLTAKYGPVCVGSDGGARTWIVAARYCAGYELRLPSLPEAIALAQNHDVPGVTVPQEFWTDDELYVNAYKAETVDESGGLGEHLETTPEQTVCVTDPSA